MSSAPATDSNSPVIPALHYRDAPAAIEWLGRVFGFTAQAVYAGPNGTVAHAQLTLGAGMIMLGTRATEGVWASEIVQPEEIGNRSTEAICLTVKDAASVYEKAKAAGAAMVMELAEMPYGGKAFACRDREGHLWSVGEFDPWQAAETGGTAA